MKIRSHVSMFVAAIAFVAVAMPIGAVRQDAPLAYKWTKGETLRYRMTQTTDTTMSGLPGGMPDVTLNQVLNQAFKMTVDDLAADGVVTLSQVFESMRMEVMTPGGKVIIDSATPAPNAGPPEQLAQKIFASLIGEPLIVRLAPSGRVQKVEGFNRLIDKMAAALPSDPAGSAAIQQLKAGMGDEQMSAMFSQGFPEFPQRALKPGDTWNTSSSIPNPVFGAVSTATELTLSSIDSQTAKILTKMKMERDPKAAVPPAAAMMGMKPEMGAATGDAELIFDVRKGQLRTATASITLPMSMSGTGPDGSPMSMRTTAKSTVKMELVEK
jgi:hypothetical protein